MKKLISFGICLMFFAISMKGQEYGLHFMQDVWQSNYTNPGFVPRQTFVFSASPFATFSADGIKGNLFDDVGGQLILNPNNVLSNLNEDIRMRSEGSADFNVGFKVSKLFISLGTSTRAASGFTLPVDAAKFLLEGNGGNNIGRTFEVGPDFNNSIYQELSLGANLMVTNQLSVGARIKRLLGINYFNTQTSALTVTTSDDIYQLDMNLNYNIQTSLPQSIVNFPRDGNFGEIQFDTTGNTVFDIEGLNAGWGFDVGAQFNLRDNIRLAVSILDLGAIGWDSDVQEVNISGAFTYEGANINFFGQDEDIDSPFDSLAQRIRVSTTTNGFSQTLPTRLYISGNIKLVGFDLGALIYSQFGDNNVSSFALSARRQFGSVFSVGAVYAMQAGYEDKFGFNFGLNAGPTQLFLVMDDVSAFFNPAKNLKRLSFRFGTGVSIGEKKMDEYIQGL